MTYIRDPNGPTFVPFPSAVVNPEEQQYLDLVRDVITTGERRPDRTGTGTLSKFGTTLTFSLDQNRMPLLTTKKVFWKGIVEELLWFISGCTNAKVMSDKGVKIWDSNGSRQFLDRQGLSHREEFDLGPVYGFQWRHSGAQYVDMNTDYTGQGVDQLQQLVHTLRTNPYDRRMLICAWNPSDLPVMALPPCHLLAQFYVKQADQPRPKLCCQMYQRSADLGLGVPFNVASYALLTHMLAHICGMDAHELKIVMGDTHVYVNHVEALNEQLTRVPRAFPRVELDETVKEIDDFRFHHVRLVGYVPDASIAMQMST